MDDQEALLKNDLSVDIDTMTSQIIVDYDYYPTSGLATSSDPDEADHDDSENKGDEQLRMFQNFVDVSSNFATLSYASRLHGLPDLVKRIKELFLSMFREVQHFGDIAGHFGELVQAFVRLVTSTRHNMNLALPHLDKAKTHMEIMSEALSSSHSQLSAEDTSDIRSALNNMLAGAEKMSNFASESIEQSERLQERIDKLTSDVQAKIKVADGRLEYSKLVPLLGGGLGVGSLTGCTVAAIESAAFGGGGALVLGGLAFPPLGALMAAAVVGGLAIGSVFTLIAKLWQRQQFKALGYLKHILDDLDTLSKANTSFVENMRRSKEIMNDLSSNLPTLSNGVANPTPRQRKLYASTCKQAITSTKCMIECINELKLVDFKELVASSSARFVSSKESVSFLTQDTHSLSLKPLSACSLQQLEK